MIAAAAPATAVREAVSWRVKANGNPRNFSDRNMKRLTRKAASNEESQSKTDAM